MNPPYNGSLHLKILKEAMQHSDEMLYEYFGLTEDEVKEIESY